MRTDFHVKIRRLAIAMIHGSTIVYVARTVYTASLGQNGGDRNGTDGQCFAISDSENDWESQIFKFFQS